MKWTYAELRKEVAAWASALRDVGIKTNDVVAGILPNCPEVHFFIIHSQETIQDLVRGKLKLIKLE